MTVDNRTEPKTQHEYAANVLGLVAKDVIQKMRENKGLSIRNDLVEEALSRNEPLKILHQLALAIADGYEGKARELATGGKKEDYIEGIKYLEEGWIFLNDVYHGGLYMAGTLGDVYVDYLLHYPQNYRNIGENEAIAFVTNYLKPTGTPKEWPPTTEEEKMAMAKADKLSSELGAEGLFGAEIGVCRHARLIAYDICERRGKKPYSFSFAMEHVDGRKSRHGLVAVFDQNENGEEIPVFIDGFNNFVCYGVEDLRRKWGEKGWFLSDGKAIRGEGGVEERQPDRSIKTIGTQWDTRVLF